MDEYSIIRLHGHPICQKKLGIVSKQKYKISTKTNKVYNITERKFFAAIFVIKHLSFLKHKFLKLQRGFEKKGILIFRCYRKDNLATLEKYSYAVRLLKYQTLTVLVILRSQYESSFSSAHSDSSSDNEQDFVCSIIPENRPNAMDIRPRLPNKNKNKKQKTINPNDKESWPKG